MEFMDGLSLDIVLQTVGRIEEKWVGRIAVSVIKGLTYLKEQFNILHRGEHFLIEFVHFIETNLSRVFRCETVEYAGEQSGRD